MKVRNYVVLLVLAISGLMLTACAGAGSGGGVTDKLDFDEIGRGDIAALDSELSDDDILATDASGIVLPAGSVILYSTRSGLYGKLRVESIEPSLNNKLTMDAVTYASDGTVQAGAEDLEIRGTYNADLETATEVGLGDPRDFHWQRASDDTHLSPKDGARFAVYSTP